MHWVGIDVGGTFTDVVLYDEERGTLTVGKSPTSPADPTLGLLAGLAKLQAALASTGRVVHGTTIGTNAILERKGARVWMLTTAGFRDTLEIARTNRTVLYDIRARKPAPLVAREHNLEVDERMAFDGSVMRPLRDDDLHAALAAIGTAANGDGTGALVIGFLHSYANPAHERAAARAAAAMLPGWFIATSEDVLPEFREYERFSTAALNAYIGPRVGGYLTRLGAALAERGYAGRVFITTSSGGIVPAEVAARFPVHTVLSGPAGGVAAAVNLGRLMEAPNLITYDMGGTSTDVCLIEGLEPTLTTEQHIAGLPNRTPQIEINSIGAGGGSVAWLDAGGALRVDPRSAGADPGPACYGRGGTEPTVTDANLVLGRLPATPPIAADRELDLEAARAALESLGVGAAEEAAEGVVTVAVNALVQALRVVSVERGHDPAGAALIAFGGAGPLHACELAAQLGATRVLCLPASGVLSAVGLAAAERRRDASRSLLTPLAEAADLQSLVKELAASRDGESVRGAADLRYAGQSFELLVPFEDPAELEEAFHAEHERRYGHADRERAVELVTVRAAAVAPGAEVTLAATGEC